MQRKMYMKNKISMKDKIEIMRNANKAKISRQALSSKIDSKPNKERLGIFETLPKDLSQEEINKIIEFSNEKVIGQIGCARIVPYSVKLTESGDIKIILVIYNGGSLQFSSTKLPLKLVDANKSIILAELVDINAVVNCGQIGVFNTIVNKERLREKNINLEQWNITFAM